MNILTIIILISILLNVFFIGIFIFARKPLFDKFFLLLKKKKGYGIVVIIKDGRLLDIRINKIGEQIRLKGDKELYTAEKEHILIDKEHSCSAVVLSEKTCKSIGVTGEASILTPKTADVAAQQMYYLGKLQGLNKILPILYIILGSIVLAILILSYVTYQHHVFLESLVQAGRTITLT